MRGYPSAEMSMNTAFAGAISAALLLALTTMANAEPARYRSRHHQDNDLAYRYPYATQRQLHNERAYQKGEYWEKLQCAHSRHPRLVRAKGAREASVAVELKQACESLLALSTSPQPSRYNVHNDGRRIVISRSST